MATNATIIQFPPNPQDSNPLLIDDARGKLKTRFIRAEYFDALAAASIYVSGPTDFTGTIAAVTQIKPDCQAIFVSLDDELDVIYLLQNGIWLAYDMRGWPARKLPVCSSLINDVLVGFSERTRA